MTWFSELLSIHHNENQVRGLTREPFITLFLTLTLTLTLT